MLLEYLYGLPVWAIPIIPLSLLPFFIIISFIFNVYMVIRKYPIILYFFKNNNIYLDEKSYEELNKVIHGDLLRNINEVNNTYKIIKEFYSFGNNNENYFVDKYNKEKELISFKSTTDIFKK
jgi:hypothetical protein